MDTFSRSHAGCMGIHLRSTYRKRNLRIPILRRVAYTLITIAQVRAQRGGLALQPVGTLNNFDPSLFYAIKDLQTHRDVFRKVLRVFPLRSGVAV